jgi:hypothetical protein
MDDAQTKVSSLQEEKMAETNGATSEYEHINERRLVRKIDWRLLPILGALYSISLIDRTNVGLFPSTIP